MIELSLLGAQALRRSDGREFGTLPAQPKRFALLAYLALGAGAFHRRDAIAAIFWPELDQFAARRALRNTLYHLREALGDGIITAQGDEAVGIDPSMLVCDVTRLREAAAASRHEEAVDLYRGELLAGLHFASSGDAFEEWLAAERARVLATVMRSIAALVDQETAAGSASTAGYWALRACALAPSDEVWLRRAMTLLDESGDRGGALRQHEAYARRLAAEFGAKPTSDTEALAQRIRNGTKSSATNGPKREAMSAARQPAATVTTTATVSATTQADDSRDAPADLISADKAPDATEAAMLDASGDPISGEWQHRGMARRYAKWLVAAVSLIALAAIGVWMARRNVATVQRQRVLVDVFDNRTGDARLESLGSMAEDWLIQGLTRTDLVDVVDPRVVLVQGRAPSGVAVDPVTLARRSGAAFVVSGSYYRSGDSLLFQAALTNAGTGRVLRVVGPIVATTERPVAALDDLRSRVMTAIASAVDVRATDLVREGVPLPSYEAYEAYVAGRDAFWHGDGRRARELFVSAMRLDTTFAAAAVGAAITASNYHDCALVDSVQKAYSTPARSLAPIDRLSLQISNARCLGRNDEMLRLTLERADLAPRTSSLQLSAAAAALWAFRPAHAAVILERMNPETDLGWSSDSTHFAYWSGLTEAYHLLGRHDDELVAAERQPVVAPLNRAWMRGRAMAALGRRDALLALVDTMATLPVETANDIGLAIYTDGRPQFSATPGWAILWIAREMMTHGDTAGARAAAARSLAWYRARPSYERDTIEERLVATWALEIMHDLPAAESMARALLAIDSTNVDYEGALAGIAAQRGEVALADSLDATLALRTDARASWSASFYRARLAALRNRPADAAARLRETLDKGAWPMWVHIEPSFASLRSQRGFSALTAPRG